MANPIKNSQRTFTLIFLLGIGLIILMPVSKSRQTLLPAVQRVEAMSSFNVNSTLDERDASLIDGICLSYPSNVCTLRAAIDQATFNIGPDTIYLQENQTYKLTLVGIDDSNTAGDLDIHSDMTIEVANGGKATIDGNGTMLNDHVFDIVQGSVTMSGLVIRNGTRGGIYNYSTLTLQDVSVQDNFGTGCGTNIHGGINNHGYLKMYRTTVSGNTGYFGGGIFNVGTLLAVNSTVSGNSAFTSGGGIANHDYGLGGGLGQMTLLNTTITLNKANICNIGGSGGGIFNQVQGGLKLGNTIVANNKRGLIFPIDDDCNGSFYAYGFNLVEVITGCHVENVAAGEILGIDPVLGPLQDNGGLTATHALLLGSPAIDSGSVAGCQDELGNQLSIDQRGINRHLNGGSGVARCDIGAYEYGVVMPPPGGTFASFIPFVSR